MLGSSDYGDRKLALVASGGMGKTTLVKHWMGRMSADGWRGARRVFDWSFYSQGTSDKAASADLFVATALRWFGDPDPAVGTPWEKGKRLARLVQAEPTLLVLDGIEPQQHRFGPLKGRLKAPALVELFRVLADDNPGLCVVTTRIAVAELSQYRVSVAPQIFLGSLSAIEGASLLSALGVVGDERQLEQAAEAYGGHPLSLRLASAVLRQVYDGDVSKLWRVFVVVIERVRGDVHPEFDEARFLEALLGALDLPENAISIRKVHPGSWVVVMCFEDDDAYHTFLNAELSDDPSLAKFFSQWGIAGVRMVKDPARIGPFSPPARLDGQNDHSRQARKYLVFISYRRVEPDRTVAWELVERLESKGGRVAIDERDFDPSSTFLEEMERCVKESTFTVAVVSSRYLQSGNTTEEAIIRKVLDMRERKRRLIPIKIEQVELPVWLYDLVGIDLTEQNPRVDPYEKLEIKLGLG